jgi:hypothetical protein
MKIPKKLWIGVIFLVSSMTAYYAGQDSVAPVELNRALIDEPLILAERSKTANCMIVNGLPDPQCTPGAIFPNATKEQVCVKGYTKTVRSVSVSLKKKVYREYGISYPPPFGSYEADHFIPLALGGSNDIANLFPEAAEPRPGFREKDLVENYLHEQVCLGNMSLTSAQRAISQNWLEVYNNLSSYELERLRGEYKNWSASRPEN